MNKKLITNFVPVGNATIWTRPNGFSADQRSAQCAAGCTNVTAVTKVSAEIAMLTARRASNDRVLFRSGKTRSSKNNRSAKLPTMMTQSSVLIFQCVAEVGHIVESCNRTPCRRIDFLVCFVGSDKRLAQATGRHYRSERKEEVRSLLIMNAKPRIC